MEENIIHVKNISKQFKISKREAGMKNAIKSFFIISNFERFATHPKHLFLLPVSVLNN